MHKIIRFLACAVRGGGEAVPAPQGTGVPAGMEPGISAASTGWRVPAAPTPALLRAFPRSRSGQVCSEMGQMRLVRSFYFSFNSPTPNLQGRGFCGRVVFCLDPRARALVALSWQGMFFKLTWQMHLPWQMSPGQLVISLRGVSGRAEHGDGASAVVARLHRVN